MLELELMRVLLISPKDPDKPGKLQFLMGGENTFTRGLLANPPPGVEYLHHNQALEQGKIVYTGFQRPLSYLIKGRILPLDVGFQCLEIKEKFDLIHCHVYCLKLSGVPTPVVLSDSSSNLLFLRDYLGWGKSRIAASYTLRKFLVKKLDIYDQNLNLKNAPLVVWSELAKRIHVGLGADPKKIVVIPPGIEKARLKKKKHRGINILFIGVWFKSKGGPLLLEAYKVLKKKYPEINLILIGQAPKGISLPKGVWQKDFVPREKLMREIFPKADILVLVPPVAEGYGLVVHEAASYGIPAVVSHVYALPELVEDKKTGFVIAPGNLEELVEKLEILVKNHPLRKKLGKEAKKRFLSKFWIKKTNEKLLQVYRAAIRR